MRLEAACAHGQDAGDTESVGWLTDGIAAIDAALLRIDRLCRCLELSRAEGREALMALAVLERMAIHTDGDVEARQAPAS